MESFSSIVACVQQLALCLMHYAFSMIHSPKSNVGGNNNKQTKEKGNTTSLRHVVTQTQQHLFIFLYSNQKFTCIQILQDINRDTVIWVIALIWNVMEFQDLNRTIIHHIIPDITSLTSWFYKWWLMIWFTGYCNSCLVVVMGLSYIKLIHSW